jgi:hypothetical protein
MSRETIFEQIMRKRAEVDALATNAGAYGVVKTNSPLQETLAEGSGTVFSRMRIKGEESDLEITGWATPGMDLKEAGKVALKINHFFDEHYSVFDMANHPAYMNPVTFKDGSSGMQVGIYEGTHMKSHYYDYEGKERKERDVTYVEQSYGFVGTFV